MLNMSLQLRDVMGGEDFQFSVELLWYLRLCLEIFTSWKWGQAQKSTSTYFRIRIVLHLQYLFVF